MDMAKFVDQWLSVGPVYNPILVNVVWIVAEAFAIFFDSPCTTHRRLQFTAR